MQLTTASMNMQLHNTVKNNTIKNSLTLNLKSYIKETTNSKVMFDYYSNPNGFV